MDYSFYFSSNCSCQALYNHVLESVDKMANGDYICNNGLISSNPIQVWFFNDNENYIDDYVSEIYGFNNNHELIFYIYQTKEEEGIKMMFEIINSILTEFDITDFVLQDSNGPWVIKSIKQTKQLRDTDIFHYPFELLECSSDFERCELERNE